METGHVTDLTRRGYRRIYSGFITGKRINKLSLGAEAWFWRILAVTDREGCVPADVNKLHSLTVGLRRITLTRVERWVNEMLTVGLLVRVGSDLLVVDFETLQPRTVLNDLRAGIPDAVRRDVLAVGYCLLCGHDQELSVDHIRPVSKGGSDKRENLQCLCLPCNMKKSNKWEADAS